MERDKLTYLTHPTPEVSMSNHPYAKTLVPGPVQQAKLVRCTRQISCRVHSVIDPETATFLPDVSQINISSCLSRW